MTRSDVADRASRETETVSLNRGRLHVLIVTQGASRDRLLNALVDHSDHAHIRFSLGVMSAEKGPLWDDMSDRSVPVYSLGLTTVTALESVPAGAFRLRRLIRVVQPDLIHSLLFYACLVTEAARTTFRAPPPSVLVRHHNRGQHLRNKPLHVRLDGWMANRATRVVAVSGAVRKTLLHEGVNCGHIDIVYNGLDWGAAVRWDPVGPEIWRQRFPGRRLVVAAGRFVMEKDYPTLLRAFARVLDVHPEVHLVIAGAGSNKARREVEDLCASMGFSDHATVVGWVPDIYNLIAAADLFVQASIDESFSQTIVEAMGLGIPLISTTPGGAAEVVGRWYEPLDPGNYEALALRICETLSDPLKAKERARIAAPEIRQRFDARTMAAGYETTYRKALAHNRQTS